MRERRVPQRHGPVGEGRPPPRCLLSSVVGLIIKFLHKINQQEKKTVILIHAHMDAQSPFKKKNTHPPLAHSSKGLSPQ